MECFLNLAWLLLAGVLLSLWLNGELRGKGDWRRQLVAVAIVIAILFPVISMSDDLLAVQNAFEADNYLRRDHLSPTNSPPVHAPVMFVAPVIFAGLGVAFLRFTGRSLASVPEPNRPVMPTIANRPPPTA